MENGFQPLLNVISDRRISEGRNSQGLGGKIPPREPLLALIACHHHDPGKHAYLAAQHIRLGMGTFCYPALLIQYSEIPTKDLDQGSVAILVSSPMASSSISRPFKEVDEGDRYGGGHEAHVFG